MRLCTCLHIIFFHFFAVRRLGLIARYHCDGRNLMGIIFSVTLSRHLPHLATLCSRVDEDALAHLFATLNSDGFNFNASFFARTS
ncbi:hypothetical protein L596_005782 [Steinernema carpocapsae]|uniref:Secreted protein n=1 Tax=Steinernema carpocapsae TaxID=34508 RepID=A0A4U8V085_STECR|nr:hypothetical protein L596_005782 [Steinernema carpocapsae]